LNDKVLPFFADEQLPMLREAFAKPLICKSIPNTT
jgi:hypothetical protein